MVLQKNSFQSWFLACRPRTLPLSLSPIIVATALASTQVHAINWFLVMSMVLSSLGIQIGTNLVNDAIDYKKGADTAERLGPMRMTQSGLLSYKQVLFAGCASFVVAVLCGIPLIIAGGWPIVCILFVSIACGYFYTGGPYPLAYTGISDVFILVFFGWVSTCTLYYLQTGFIDFACFLAGTQVGLLAVIPHAINNLRDRKTDALVHKNTTAVRFGIPFARWEITCLSLIPFVLGLIWIPLGHLWAFLLPFTSIGIVMRNLSSIWGEEPSPKYNQFLSKSAICALLFGCLLGFGILVT